MRCACGNVFNTDDAHIGRQLKCRCGRTVAIERPTEEYAEKQAAAQQAAGQSARKSERASRKSGARAPSAFVARLRDIPHAVLRALQTVVTDSLLAVGSRRRTRRYTARLSWLYLVVMLAAWIALIQFSEQFLPATLLAYGPRFVLLAPLVLLVPIALLAVRSALLPLTLAALVCLGPIMGGRVSRHSLFRALPSAPPTRAIRVISYNTFGESLVYERLPEILALRPDLIAFQECSERLWNALERLRSLYSVRYHSLCTVSRWPIVAVDSMPRADILRSAINGSTGSALLQRHSIESPYGLLMFVNLHLETPRKGLSGYIGSDGFIPDDIGSLLNENSLPTAADVSNAERLAANVSIREREAERAALWSIRGDKSVPAIVAGDFNMPVESSIFRRFWSGYTDAFESAGSGFGFSKFEGILLRARIDHVLGNPAAPRSVGTWIGPDFGSDHRPVITDLQF